MNERREPSDESLDDLLGRAEWPAMGAAAEQRLRATWRGAFDHGPRRAYWPVGLAAAIACAALAGWWVLRGGEPRDVVTRTTAADVRPVVLLTPIPRGETRTPTPMERLLVASSRSPARGAAAAVTPAPPARPKDQQDPVRAMLASRDARQVERFLQLVLNPSTRDAALRALREAEDPPVDALIAHLANPRVERRFAAARALGEVCDPAVVERLWRMVSRGAYRREALAALTQCHDPRAGRLLAAARDDPGLESQLRSVRQQMERIF